MQIPQKSINRFKVLYKREFGVELTDEEAQKQGVAVMRLVAVRQMDKLMKGEKMSNQQHPYPEIQLKDVLRVLDKTIKEDNTNKAIIFLGMLSAFTEESQLNITLNAPSSAGKTYLVKEIVKLFPKADCIQFSNATPTAIFYGEDAKNDKERKARIVDLERKILIFMEQPDSKAQEKIRAVLSHDQKECVYNITNRNKEGANRAEKVIIRGYPASIFCSANLSLDEQESTRAIMLSPEMTATKIEQAKQNIAALKADSKAYYKQINEDEERKALKCRLVAIRDMHEIGRAHV